MVIALPIPFCSWGLCQNQPADITVLMSSSHRLLILHSPQSRREIIKIRPKINEVETKNNNIKNLCNKKLVH
jgi:hypothetical protein